MFPYEKEEARLSGYRAELVIQRPRVRVLTCLLAVGITLLPVGILNHVMFHLNYLFYSS